ncbi:MAG: hypothetical protein WA639_21620 [Candidatus Acidiferrum sp.]
MNCLGEAAVVRGLLIGALFFGGSGRTEGAFPSASQVRAEAVELTNNRTTGSFAVPADTLASAPPVVALVFPRVINPANTPFVICVYLSYRPGEGKVEAPLRILLGNGTLYPADRPGGFRLRTSAAFRKLKAAKARDVRLLLEMKRLRPTEPWSQVEITVRPPEWRGENSTTR